MPETPSKRIQSQSAVPIPSQLRDLLLEEINCGRFAAGQRIPPERALAVEYQVSRASVRASIAELINAGVLYRAVGKGTFVAERAEGKRPEKAKRNIAFLISEGIFQFVETGYDQILTGVEEFCRNEGYFLIFHTLNEKGKSKSLSALLGEEPASLDGCVVTGGVREHTLEQIAKAKVPSVIVDLLISEHEPGLTTVRIDYQTGTRLAVEHLVELGHREIGFIGFPGSDKYRAYWENLERLSLPYNPRNVSFLQLVGLKPGILAGYQSMRKMIAHGSRPTALLVTNDLVALGVLEALAVAGISVPDQVSVVGFDDIGRVTNPPLTTIRVDLTEVGRLAGEALLKHIKGQSLAHEQITVSVELIVRGSTAPPPSLR